MIEWDTALLDQPPLWTAEAPAKSDDTTSKTPFHLLSNGCVHVYGTLPMKAVARHVPLPFENGLFVFPDLRD